MKLLRLILPLLSIVFAGCDTISGVTRGAKVHALPDLHALKTKIESYPEVKEVKLWDAAGSRPLTLTGIKKADEVFYLSYTDRVDVRGTLMFIRDYKGEVSYSQYLIMMNRRPPQSWIDATWPVMKKIERDLEESFGLPEIPSTLKTSVVRVEDPERKKPNQTPEPTPMSVTPPAAQEPRQP
jgi:hypothetical protein